MNNYDRLKNMSCENLSDFLLSDYICEECQIINNEKSCEHKQFVCSKEYKCALVYDWLNRDVSITELSNDLRLACKGFISGIVDGYDKYKYDKCIDSMRAKLHKTTGCMTNREIGFEDGILCAISIFTSHYKKRGNK